MTLDMKSLTLLTEALNLLDEGFAKLPSFEPQPDLAAMQEVLSLVARRMQDNYPYQHPMYAGQMMKPPHPIARLAYTLSLWINPNNHALDGGRASSAMEKEAVAGIAQMFGWHNHLGHLCGGGTMANLEALWVAGRLRPGEKIVASEQAHYTHSRISEVLQVPFQTIPVDSQARMDICALEKILKTEKVGTVVATMGTTATGSVDPLPDLLSLQDTYQFRIHADAAYGGYFNLLDNVSSETSQAYKHLDRVDSLAIDPHKHGLQPYGCGCILFRDPEVGALYKHDSPYTYFSSAELHLGEISLECSRAGASAVALWATQRLLPLTREGQFAADLAKSRQAAVTLADYIKSDSRFMLGFEPQLDIVIWAPRFEKVSQISETSRALFEAAENANLHLAVVSFPKSLLQQSWPTVIWDEDQVTCLRSCLMKPEHLDWVDRIWEIFLDVAESLGL